MPMKNFPSEFEMGYSLQFLNLLHKRMYKENSLNSLLNDIRKSNSIVAHWEHNNKVKAAAYTGGQEACKWYVLNAGKSQAQDVT